MKFTIPGPARAALARLVPEGLLLIVGAIALVEGVVTIASHRGIATLGGIYVGGLGFVLLTLTIAAAYQERGEGADRYLAWTKSPGVRWSVTGAGLFLAYVVMLATLGYAMATGIFLIVYLRIFGKYGMPLVVTASVGVAVASALAWNAIGVLLPRGPLGWP